MPISIKIETVIKTPPAEKIEEMKEAMTPKGRSYSFCNFAELTGGEKGLLTCKKFSNEGMPLFLPYGNADLEELVANQLRPLIDDVKERLDQALDILQS
jgi:hypothetical protein